MSETVYCCPEGSVPSLVAAAHYDQKGHTDMLGDLPVYIVGPSPSLTAVIVSYDIYGFNGGRIRNICDEFAQSGHLVILPDYFRGDCWSAEREKNEPDVKKEWVQKLSAPDDIRRDLNGLVVPFLRSQGVVKIAYVGYCFGGYVSFIGCQEDNIACGVGVHSALKIFNFHNSSEATAASAVTCPQMLLQAGNDPENTKPDGEVHQVLLSMSVAPDCVVREFPNVSHGWVPRGNLGDDVVAENVKSAMELTISFINKHLASDITCCCPMPMSG